MYGRRRRFFLRFLMHGRLLHGRRRFGRLPHRRRLHHRRWLRNGLRGLRLREQAATTPEQAAARAAASRAATA
ncbi:hypothetical protein A5678_08675 [Mycobacterium sp. E2733]|nr:hypothetical protein A5678_08675 [Mycobacterium sp. E2733]